MSVKKVIVCLANSWKHSDRCVAGIEWIDNRCGGWIRPISARNGHGVSFSERRLACGEEPAPLDVLEVPLLTARPTDYQSENWLLDPAGSWSKIGKWRWGDLECLEDRPADLWGIGDSSGKGANDRIAEVQAMDLTDSLALIRVRALVLHVFDGGFQQVRREVRAIFKYRKVSYNLKVTDPIYVNYYLSQDDGRYRLGECYLTVSLAEPFRGFCYKLVAAVLEPGGPPEER